MPSLCTISPLPRPNLPSSTLHPHAPAQFWHDERQAWFSNCLFRPYVCQGDDVEYDDTVVAHFKPLYDSDSEVQMPIYIINGAPPR